ncbi:MAG: hypothetical protein RL734_979 [Bacteroidota bacterium]
MKIPMQRSLIAIVGFVSLIVGIFSLVTYFPPDTNFYVPCLFHLSTGLHCPGCGSTRAVSSFMHGDITIGLKNNLLIILWGPYLIYRLFLVIFSWIDGKQRVVWSPPSSTIIIFLIITIIYTILRNLPIEPFVTLFAPVE